MYLDRLFERRGFFAPGPTNDHGVLASAVAAACRKPHDAG